jgi:hypothetical protein
MDEAARLERVSRKLTAVPDVQLAPPLTEDQVCTYEARNKIKLPAAYRLFVTRLGNGGPGPYGTIEELDADRHDPSLSRPFVWAPHHLPDRGWRSVTDLTTYPGALKLNHQGPESWFFHDDADPWTVLVLTGDGRGRMAMVDEDTWGDWHFAPIFHPAPDFLAWYEEWLDNRLSGRKQPGDNDFSRRYSMHVLLRSGTVDEAVWAARIEAADATRDTMAPIIRKRAHELAEAAAWAQHPTARSAAIWALGKIGITDALRADVTRRAAQDPAQSVRLQARRSLGLEASSDPLGSPEELQDWLRTAADAALRYRCVVEIGASRDPWALTALLQTLKADPDPEVRLGVLRALIHRLPEVTAIGLADPDPGVRTQVLRELTNLRAPGWDSAARHCTTDPDQRTRDHAINDLRWAGLLT